MNKYYTNIYLFHRVQIIQYTVHVQHKPFLCVKMYQSSTNTIQRSEIDVTVHGAETCVFCLQYCMCCTALQATMLQLTVWCGHLDNQIPKSCLQTNNYCVRWLYWCLFRGIYPWILGLISILSDLPSSSLSLTRMFNQHTLSTCQGFSVLSLSLVGTKSHLIKCFCVPFFSVASSVCFSLLFFPCLIRYQNKCGVKWWSGVLAHLSSEKIFHFQAIKLA